MKSLERLHRRYAFFSSTRHGLQKHLSISQKAVWQHHARHTAKYNDDNGSVVSRNLSRCNKRQGHQSTDEKQNIKEVRHSINKPLNSYTYNDRNIDEQMTSRYCNNASCIMSSDSAPCSDDSFFYKTSNTHPPHMQDYRRQRM